MSTGEKKSVLNNLSKGLTRTKEKVLQNFGKADRTVDEEFGRHVENFGRQVTSASRYQKELKNFVACARAMSNASRSFYATLLELYEPEWDERSRVQQTNENLLLLWENYLRKLTDEVQTPLNQYIDQFGAVKAKIQKRERKLIDYDHARHNVEAQLAAKKRDETKLQKTQEEMLQSRKTYEDLNAELNQHLPQLYQSRVGFFVSNFLSVFAAEAIIHSEFGRDADVLANSLRTSPAIRNPAAAPAPAATTFSATDRSSSVSTDGGDYTYATVAKSPPPVNGFSDDEEDDDQIDATPPVSPGRLNEIASPEPPSTKAQPQIAPEPVIEPAAGAAAAQMPTPGSGGDAVRSSTPTPTGESRPELSAGNRPSQNSGNLGIPVLYKVQATHAYVAEDSDEISFDVGDIINVVEYDDPEEQDDGWLMGVLATGGAKGVFPANFTKPV